MKFLKSIIIIQPLDKFMYSGPVAPERETIRFHIIWPVNRQLLFLTQVREELLNILVTETDEFSDTI